MKILTTLFSILGWLLLILLLLIVAAVIVVVPVRYYGWSIEEGAMLLGVVVAGIVLILLLRRWWRRRREERFVNRMIQQDEAAIDRGPEHSREHLLGLQGRWQEAMKVLRRSALARHGDPIYALPWYMLLGESGSGKSSMAQRSGLISPVSAGAGGVHLTSTRDCEWWFLDDAVLLDTAGRYAQGETDEDGEWLAFLRLLARYRSREPINGLVITVSAERLQTAGDDELSASGQQLRMKIDSLMRTLGHRFPVYVMVTKIDAALGMTEFASMLPDEARGQCMGLLKDRADQPAEDFLNETFQTVGEQLRDLRLILLYNQPDLHPSAMLFPDEVMKLKRGLAAFVQGAFHSYPYQVQPLLRGIHFSSAMTEGGAAGAVAHELGLPEEVVRPDPGAGGPLFLKQFFQRVLPGDRSLHSPVPEFLRPRRLLRNAAVGAWVCMGLALCALLCISFLLNWRALGTYEESVQPRRQYGLTDTAGQAGPSFRIGQMETLRDSILKIEARNDELWWTFGLNRGRAYEAMLKATYVDGFQAKVVKGINEDLYGRVQDHLGTQVRHIETAAYFELLVRRINILRAALAGELNAQELAAMPMPSPAVMLAIDPKMPHETAGKFSDLYRYAVLWNRDTEELGILHDHLHAWLIDLTRKHDEDFGWLVAWANQQLDLGSVTPSQFWGTDMSKRSGEAVDAEVTVPRAYTQAGLKAMDALTRELYAALLEHPKLDQEEHQRLYRMLEERNENFLAAYQLDYWRAWLAFAEAFPKGRARLRSLDHLQEVAGRSAEMNGPYTRLLMRLAEELHEMDSPRALPGWVHIAWRFRTSMQKTANETALDLEGGARALADAILGKPRPGLDETGTPYGDVLTPENLFMNYRQALGKAKPVPGSTADRKEARDRLAALFEQSQDSYFVVAEMANDRYRGSVWNEMANTEGARPTWSDREQAIWRLVRGPLDLLLYYCSQETAVMLQAQWDEQVRAPLSDIPREKRAEELFRKNEGLVWKFAAAAGEEDAPGGPAAPFLFRQAVAGRAHYKPRMLYGEGVPFRAEFLEFLERGSYGQWGIQDAYRVLVKGMPTDVSYSVAEGPFAAIERPYATVLMHQLPEASTRLENYNYPVSGVFGWSPEKGGKMELQIKFESVTLTKKWEGRTAFAKFIADFTSGSTIGAKTYTPEDFPAQAERLKALHIKNITVRYEFAGDVDAIRRFLEIMALETPRRITQSLPQ